MLAWTDRPVRAPDLRRVAWAGAWLFAAIAAQRLAEFHVYGTMGPLGVQQPIFRLALTNGLVSAAVIILAWIGASLVLARPRRRVPWFRPAWTLAGTAIVCLAVILGVAVAAGLPLQRTFAYWWPAIPFLAPAAALLVALTGRRAAAGI
jgi:hypothetical protein